MASRRAVKASPAKKAHSAQSRARRGTAKRAKRPAPVARAQVPRNRPVAPIEEPPPADRAHRFDSILDRRIIEGMLHDREALMSEMGQRGISNGTVLRRAAELGLSEALIRQVKGVAADLAGERPGRRSPPPSLGARTCLCCDRVFLSAGPGNRLCMRCRGGDAGLAQL